MPAGAANLPRMPLLVDVAHGTIGGVGVGSDRVSPVGSLGRPDYALDPSGPNVTMIWSQAADPTFAWAVATLPDATSQRLASLRVFDGFRTTRGDRKGTPLATFLRHWSSAGPVIAIVGRRKALEYNVVVGPLVFAFDRSQTLQGVGLTRGVEGSFCVLPTPCLGETLSFAAGSN